MTTQGTSTDPRVQEAKKWQAEEYTQQVQPHGGIDQQETQYAVVKFADMD